MSFSAGLTRKPFPSDAGVVLFNKVLVNDGDVYDPSTGESAHTHTHTHTHTAAREDSPSWEAVRKVPPSCHDRCAHAAACRIPGF